MIALGASADFSGGLVDALRKATQIVDELRTVDELQVLAEEDLPQFEVVGLDGFPT